MNDKGSSAREMEIAIRLVADWDWQDVEMTKPVLYALCRIMVGREDAAYERGKAEGAREERERICKIGSDLVWSVWSVAHKALADSKGSHTEHLTEALAIKAEAIKGVDALAALRAVPAPAAPTVDKTYGVIPGPTGAGTPESVNAMLNRAIVAAPTPEDATKEETCEGCKYAHGRKVPVSSSYPCESCRRFPTAEILDYYTQEKPVPATVKGESQ